MSNISYIHPSYMKKEVYDYVKDLVVENKYCNYTDLSRNELERFAALLMKAAGKDQVDFLVEHNYSNELATDFRLLMSGSDTLSQEDFLFRMKCHAIEYYDETMKNIFNDVLFDRAYKINDWYDTYSVCDPDELYSPKKENLL